LSEEDVRPIALSFDLERDVLRGGRGGCANFFKSYSETFELVNPLASIRELLPS